MLETKDYITIAIASIALLISVATFYLGNFSTRDDLRVTIYAPRTVELVGSDFAATKAALLFTNEIKIQEHETKRTPEEAKSFKLAVKVDVVLINAGPQPVLISAINLILYPRKGGDAALVDCLTKSAEIFIVGI